MHEGAPQISPAPTAEEAAAAIAAIERFLQDTATAAVADTPPGQSGWLRAALHQGVGVRDPDRVW